MTIIVFDKSEGKVYADSRASRTTASGKFQVSDDNRQKLFNINNEVAGFAGVCDGIDSFVESYKNGYIKKTSRHDFCGVIYNRENDNFYIIKSKENKRNIFYIIFSTIGLVASLSQDINILMFFALFTYCMAYTVPAYFVEFKKSPSGNFFYFGSGGQHFSNRHHVYNDSYESIKSVYLEDRCCNSNIKSLDINNFYWDEDIH